MNVTPHKFGTVLVTGGNGIVGSHVVDAFISDGTFARVVATQHRQKRYQNPKAIYRSFNHRSLSIPETEEQTILSTLKSGTSAYGRTKGAAEALVLAYNTRIKQTSVDDPGTGWQNALFTASLRIGGLYGERDETTIGKLLKLVDTFSARVQIGPNKAVHNWVYTENAALAHVLASKALLDVPRPTRENKVDGEAFFITDGAPMPFWDFSRKVFVKAGDSKLRNTRDVRIYQIPFGVVIFLVSLGEMAYKVFTLGHKKPKMVRHHFEFMRKGCSFSIEKARKRLGYEPVCGTDEGIRRSVKWFREGHATS